MSLRRWCMISVLWATTLAAPARGQGDAARLARDLVVGLDFEAARGLLAVADPDAPRVALERGRLALYDLDCDDAAVILARPEVQKVDDGAFLAEIARGCQRATAALATDKDDARGIEIWWQDQADAPLAPLLFDTVAQARDTLSRDLGVDWPRPTRVVVVRDLLSLSAMTGLPYASAKTTGTVAVAKWGRVTLLSPRASPNGYVWRDTIAHELTHLAVTRASRDRAPLWLQEGVAKYEESRWRVAKPFDDRPAADAVAKRGIDSGRGVALDRMGPSIAMLPSAEAATFAFAEVTSFVQFYLMREGDGALPKLLGDVKQAPDVDAALVSASGAGLKAWEMRWRAYLAARPFDRGPLAFAMAHSKDDKRSFASYREQRDRARLAELLLARGHASAAVKELDALELAARRAPADVRERQRGDPRLRWLRGLALEPSDREWADEGRKLFDDPQELLLSYGPWWASRGRWARGRGDEASAAASFAEAVDNAPLDPEAACETRPGSPSPERSADPLCAAAQSWAPVPFED
jgi:hypothetical protein